MKNLFLVFAHISSPTRASPNNYAWGSRALEGADQTVREVQPLSEDPDNQGFQQNRNRGHHHKHHQAPGSLREDAQSIPADLGRIPGEPERPDRAEKSQPCARASSVETPSASRTAWTPAIPPIRRTGRAGKLLNRARARKIRKMALDRLPSPGCFVIPRPEDRLRIEAR